MTKFDIGGRQIGKTTRLLQWLEEAPKGELRVMVVHSQSEAERLAKLCDDRGYTNITESHFVTLNNMKYLRGIRGNIRFGVDNLDIMLYELFGNSVDYVTATGDNVQI